MNRDKSIARLILSTGRKKREFDLMQVYDDITFLLQSGETIKSLSEILGISVGMLNQFLKAGEVCSEIKTLIKERKIDSVTLIHNLSKFNKADQILISKALLKDEITPIEVRDLVPLRNAYPNIEISNLIKKLIDSKNKKLSVIKFPKESLSIKVDQFIKIIKEIIEEKNFNDFIEVKKYYFLKITKKGTERLREKAKSEGETLNSYFNKLLS